MFKMFNKLNTIAKKRFEISALAIYIWISISTFGVTFGDSLSLFVQMGSIRTQMKGIGGEFQIM